MFNKTRQVRNLKFKKLHIQYRLHIQHSLLLDIRIIKILVVTV